MRNEKQEKITLSDITYEILYLSHIVALHNLRKEIKDRAYKILDEEYGLTNGRGYSDFYLPYSHPRFSFDDFLDLNQYEKIIKPHRFKNLSDRIFSDKVETTEEKIMKLKENLQVVNNQIKIRPDNKNYHRIKFMLEVKLEKLEGNLPELSIEELRDLVRKNGYMNEDFERELELGKRLAL